MTISTSLHASAPSRAGASRMSAAWHGCPESLGPGLGQCETGSPGCFDAEVHLDASRGPRLTPLDAVLREIAADGRCVTVQVSALPHRRT